MVCGDVCCCVGGMLVLWEAGTERHLWLMSGIRCASTASRQRCSTLSDDAVSVMHLIIYCSMQLQLLAASCCCLRQ